MCFDGILVPEYGLFERSNRENLLVTLVQWPVSRVRVAFRGVGVVAAGPCVANQLRDVGAVCGGGWYVAAHVWRVYNFEIGVVPLVMGFGAGLTTVVKFEVFRISYFVFRVYLYSYVSY